MRRILAATALVSIALQPAMADGLQRVEDRSRFVDLVQGQNLKRLGVNLAVSADGRIKGRAFGQSVTGAWQWDGGFFCRDLNWGGDPYDSNCQLVQVDGDKLRFTSDKGQGRSADFWVR